MHRLIGSCDLDHPKDRIDSVIRAFHVRLSSLPHLPAPHYPLIGSLSLRLSRLNCLEGIITSPRAVSGRQSRNIIQKEAGMSLRNWTCFRARSALGPRYPARNRRVRSRTRRIGLEDGQARVLCSGLLVDCRPSCEDTAAGRVVS